MQSHRRLAHYIAAVSLIAMGVGCGKDTTDPNDPDNPNALGLAVAVRTDPSTFQQTGEFSLELIPTTREGLSLVFESWDISTTVAAPGGVAPLFVSQNLQPPDTTPSNVALLVDNSASMLKNDPDRLRAAAAKLLWETLLGQQRNGQVSLLYFGFVTPPTPGFTATRLLQTWTSDPNLLSGILDTLQVGTSSRIYSSARDVVEWFDTTTSNDHRRVLLLLTDGKLNLEGGVTVSEVLAAARRTRVSIGTVGLGPASDRGSTSEPEAVALLQELANGSGGLYAGAAIPERLSSTLLSLTAWNSTGLLLAHFKLSPTPTSGAQVTGNVKLVNDRLGTAQGLWSFIAP